LSNQWLEEDLSSSFGLEFFNDFIVFVFNLSESNSVEHVLNESNSLFNGGDVDGQFVVFGGPFGMFGFSLSGSGFDLFNDFFEIVLSLSEFFSGLFLDGGGLFDLEDQRSDLSLGIIDVFVEGGDVGITFGLFGGVGFISLILFLLDLVGDLIHDEVDFLNWVSNFHVHVD